MNNSFARLVDGMCATLRSEVLTRIDDEFARSQVYGVISLLNTFKVRADWSSAFLTQQIDAQREALLQVTELLHRSPVADQAPKADIPDVPSPTSVADLLAARDRANLSIGQLLAWLHDDPGARQVSAEDGAALQQALRSAMRAEVDIELKYASRPMFAEMSGAAES
jgi:hypothetical protein